MKKQFSTFMILLTISLLLAPFFIQEVRADSTFGDISDGTSHATVKDSIKGTEYDCPEAGTANFLQMRVGSVVVAGNVRLALYKASDKSFVGETEEVFIDSTGVKTFDFAEPKPSVEATTYIIVGWAETDVRMRYEASASHTMHQQAIAYNGFPNPLDSSTGEYRFCGLCDYTPSAGEFTEEFSETTGISASLYLWKALFEKYEETITVSATSYGWKEKRSFHTETTTITEELNEWIELRRFFTESIIVTETAGFTMEIMMEFIEFTETITIEALPFLWKAKQFITQETIGPAANFYEWISLFKSFVETVETTETRLFLIEKLLSITESISVSTSLTVLKEALVTIIEFTELIDVDAIMILTLEMIVPEIEPSTFGTLGLVIAIVALAIAVTAFAAKTRD